MCVQRGREDTLSYVNLYYHKVVVGRTVDDDAAFDMQLIPPKDEMFPYLKLALHENIELPILLTLVSHLWRLATLAQRIGRVWAQCRWGCHGC